MDNTTDFNLREWLALVAREIRINGWISGKQAWNEKIDSTATKAKSALLRSDITPLDEDYKLAEDTIIWVREDLTPSLEASRKPATEYQIKLATIFMSDELGEKQLATAASAIKGLEFARARAIEEAEKAVKRQDQEFYGEEAQRYNLKLTIDARKEMVGEFGFTVLYTMTDKEGRHFKWFATGEKNADLELNARYAMRGTVKRHDIDRFSGNKVTLLSRCKVGDKLA